MAHDLTQKSELIRLFLDGTLPAELMDKIERLIATDPTAHTLLDEQARMATFITRLQAALSMPLFPSEQNDGATEALRKAVERLVKQANANDDTAAVPSNTSTASEAKPKRMAALPFLSPPQESAEMGRLNGYRVLKQLGEGGMGIVFEAEDIKLKRRVALKVMKPEIAAKEQHRVRFIREAQTAARVEHDHICPIYEVGEENGVPFIAMPFLKGEPLDAYLKRKKPLPPDEAIRIGREVAEGLFAAHREGLVHRDIKPGNIWLETRPNGQSRARILDFGLARAPGEDVQITASGAILGTPAYMAPEQARGRIVDHRADLFSLGVILYEMTTGRRPFTGTDTMAVLTSLAIDDPTPPHVINPSISGEFSALIMALLSKTPERRPGTGRVVSEALVGILARTSRPIVEAIPGGVASVADAADATAVDPWGGIDEMEPVTAPDAAPVRRDAEVLPGGAHSGRDTKPVSRDVRTLRSGARTPQRSRLNPKVMIAAALLLLIGGGFAVYKLALETKDGTLVVEVDGLDTDLRFKNGELQIYGEDGKLKYTLKPGERSKTMPPGKYTVRVVGADGVRLDTDKFEMSRDGKVVLRVTADAVAKKQPLSPAEVAEAARRTEANGALPALEAKFKAADVTFVSFAKDVGDFKAKHGGTPAAIKASEMLMKLQSPLDDLNAAKILDDAKSAWKAHGFDSRDIVGVFGEHRQRHWAGRVRAIFSPDGKRVASCSALDHTVQLWDAETLELQQVLRPGVEGIRSLAFTPDNKHLLIASHFTNVLLWDLERNVEVRRYAGHKHHSWSVAISADGKRVWSGGYDFSVRAWNLADGKLEFSVTPHKGWVDAIAVCPRTGRAISCGHDGNIWLWEMGNDKPVRALAGHQANSQPICVALSEDGHRAVTCADGDDEMILWDVEQGTALQRFKGHGSSVFCAAISRDGKLAVSGSADRTVRLWDATNGKEIRKFEGHTDQILSVAISPDGKRILSGSEDGTLRLWNVETGREIQPLTGPVWRCCEAAFSPDTGLLCTLGHDGYMRVWDALSGTEKSKLQFSLSAGAFSGGSLSFTSDSSRAIFSAGWGHNAIETVDVQTAKSLAKFRPEHADSGYYSVAFSPDRSKALTGGWNGTVSLWDMSSGQKIRDLDSPANSGTGHAYRVTALAFSPDARYALGGRRDLDAVNSTLYLWELETGKVLSRLNGHGPAIQSIAFSPSGLSAVSSGDGGDLHLWRLTPTRTQLHAFTGASYEFVSLSWSPDGRQFVSGGHTGKVILWDGATLTKLREWLFPGQVRTVAFSTDGRHIATANGNGTAYILRIAESPHSAERDLKALQIRHGDPKADRESLRKDLQAFRVRYASFPEHTVRAAEMLMMSPSPLDALDPAKIPEDAKADWKMNGFDGKDVVAVVGEHRQRHWAPIGPIVVSPDGKWVASAQFGRVHLWNAETLELLAVIPGSGGEVFSLAWSPDGMKLAFSNGSLPVSFWDVSGKSPKQLKSLTGHTNNTASIAFSPDGKSLAYSSSDSSIWLWDVSADEPKVLRSLKNLTEQYHTLMFTPDSKRLIYHGSQEIIRIWNWRVTDNTEFVDLKLPGQQIWSVDISANGKFLASACASGQGSLWDLSGESPSQRVLRETGASRVAFAPDNKKLAIGDSGGGILLWDIDGPEPIEKGSFKAHTQRPDTVRFGPDSKTLVSKVKDVETKLWDIESKKERGALLGNLPAFTPDGRRLLTTTGNALRLWDAATGKELKPLTGPVGVIPGVAFGSDGSRLYSGGADRTVRLWNLALGKEERAFTGNGAFIRTVATSVDGQRVLAGDEGAVIRLWDGQTGNELGGLVGHAHGVHSLAVSPDGRYALSGADDVRLWDLKTAREMRRFEGHTGAVASVAFSADARRALSGSHDFKARIWDVSSGKSMHVLDGHTNHVTTVGFSPDDRYVLTGSVDATVRLWDSKTGKGIERFDGFSSALASLAIAPDGQRFVSASADGRVNVWDVVSRTKLREWQIPGPVHAVAFAADGRHIATANANGTVYILRIADAPWYAEQDLNGLQTRLSDPKSDRESLRKDLIAFRLKYASLPDHCVRAAEMQMKLPSPLDAFDAARISEDAKAAWKTSGFDGKDVVAVLGEHQRRHWSAVSHVCDSSDGRQFASAAANGSVTIWDSATRKELRTFYAHDDPITGISFQPGGTLLATCSHFGGTRLWDLSTGHLIQKLGGHAGVTALAFSGDGKVLATGGSADHSIHLWQVETGKRIHTLKGHTNWVISVAISRDGKTVASGSRDGSVILWETKTGAELRTLVQLEKPGNHDWQVAFSPQGETVLGVMGTGGGLIAWETATGKKLHDFPGQRFAAFRPGKQSEFIASSGADLKSWDLTTGKERWTIKNAACSTAAFLPNDGILVSGHDDGIVRFWDVDAGKEVQPLMGPFGPVTDQALSPDDRVLLTVGGELTLRSWDLPGLRESPQFPQVKSLSRNYSAGVAISPDGQTFAVVNETNVLQIRDVASSQVRYDLRPAQVTHGMAFSPDGRTLASADGAAGVTLWDVATGQKRLSIAVDNAYSIVFDPSGATIAVGQEDYSVHLYDTTSGAKRRQIAPLGTAPSHIRFSPNGRTIAAVGGNANDLAVHDARTGGLLFNERNGRFAFSPDGKSLAVCRARGIALFDAPKGQKLREFVLPGPVHAVAFAADGRHIVTANGNGTIYIVRVADSPWYAEHDLNRLQIRFSDPKSDRVSLRKDLLAFRVKYAALPDYSLRATELLSKLPSPLDALDAKKLPPESAGYWKALDQRPPSELVGVLGEHRQRIWSGTANCLSISSDGKFYAVGEVGISLFDASTGGLMARLGGGGIVDVAIAPDCKTLVSCAWGDTNVRLWDIATRKEIAVLAGHTAQVRAVAFHKDGRILASASQDSTLKLWDIVAGKELATIEGHSAGVFGVAFSPDGTTVASGGGDRTVRLWDITTHKELVSLTGHTNTVYPVAFSPDGKLLASGGVDRSVKLWDVVNGKELKTLTGHTGPVGYLAFSPDGKTLASCYGHMEYRNKPAEMKLWDVVLGQERFSLPHRDQVNGVAFGNDSKTAATVTWDGMLRLWDVEAGKEIKPLTEPLPVKCVAFAPDDSVILAGREGPLGLLDPIKGTELKRFDPVNVFDASFSSDGRWVCSVPRDGSVRLLEATTGVEVRNLKGFPNNPYCAAFLPGHTRLLVGTDSGYAIVWDIEKAVETVRLSITQGGVTDVHVSSDGRQALCTSVISKLFDLQTGKELRDISFKGFTCVRAKFSPDGKIIAIACSNGRIILQDAASGVNLHDWQLPGSIGGLAFANDGRHLATANGNGTVYILRLPKLPGPDQRKARLIFDGTVGSASVPDFKLGNIETLTIEGFFTPVSDGQTAWSTTGFVANALTVDPTTNHWLFVWQDGNNIVRKVQSKYPYVKDRRVHVAGVLDGLQLRLYIDGKREDTFDLSVKPKIEERRGLLVGNSFGGIVDNVRVSKVARYRDDFIPTQRAEPEKDTLALYRCDEGQGDKLTDLSGNNHHATIVGAKWASPDGTVSEVRPTVTPDARFALQFDTSSTSVSLPDVQIDLAKSGSFELWMELQSPKRKSLSLMLTGKNQLLYLETIGGDVLQLVVVPNNLGPGQKSDCRISKTRLPAGWVHVAASWSQGAGRLFVNGKLIKEQVDFEFDFPAKLASTIGRYAAMEPGPAILPSEAFLNISQVRIANDARFTKEFVPNRRFTADAGTVALYQFDEGQGDKLNDSSGNNHHGKIVGAKWITVEGAAHLPRSGLQFDGKSSYVDVPTLRLDTETATVEAVVTVQEVPAAMAVLHVGGKHYVLMPLSTSNWGMSVFRNGTSEGAVGLNTVKKSEVVHVAIVRDATAARLFVNGKRYADPWNPKDSPKRVLEFQSVATVIGGIGPLDANAKPFVPFPGIIHEIRISKAARYTKDYDPPSRFAADKDTLALYRFDEGQGDKLTDYSGNNHHGKIVGAKWVNANGDAPVARTTEQVKQQQADAAKALAIPVTSENSIGMKLNLIPAGTFLMGSPDNEPGRDADEGPQRTVRITRPFRFGVLEVTVGQFKAFVEATAYVTEAEKSKEGSARLDYEMSKWIINDSAITWRTPGWEQTDDHPVACVSWNDAVAFCAWLSKKEGKKYRLPTEAEWEYACRAGTTSPIYDGDIKQNANYNGEPDSFLGSKDALRRLVRTGSYAANAFGLHDMHGNVWEWCSDWYGPYPKESPDDPTGPAAGEKRVNRGGAFHSPLKHCRSAYREKSLTPNARGQNIGFRVVCELNP